MSDRRRAAALSLGVSLTLVFGCSTLDRPGGSGFPSYIAETVMRVSMVVAFEGADFTPVAGRRFDVEVTGMATDELESYLSHIARTLGREAGGVYDPRRAESVVELAVHACGTDLDEAPAEVALVIQDAIFTGVTFADLRFRDAAGAVTEPQTLYGVASHRQTVVLTIFEDKGRYFRRTYPWLDGVLSNDDASPIDPLRYRFPRPRDGRQLDRPAEPPEGGVEEPT